MELCFMKKADNYTSSLDVFRTADFSEAQENEIHRMGVIGQFNLTFELAWKALQAVLCLHGIQADTGLPREILKLGYQTGFLQDAAVWLTMLRKRNTSIYIYDEDEADELVLMIRDSFLPAFSELEATLEEKIREADQLWD